MKEIEVKILNINVEKARKKILGLGAEKTFSGEINIINFDFPDDRIKKAEQLLRLRQVGEEVELCFKEKKEISEFKSLEETEVTTNNFETTAKIFEKLGFKKIYEGKKKRESYRLGNIKFEIDTYSEVPTYLEIEAPTKEEVKEYVEKLGFTMAQTTSISAYELDLHYRKNETPIN